VLVVALGADYDMDATPGLAEAGNEFYSAAGAERLAQVLPTFSRGRAIIGVCGAPFKCPPAPSEAALLLHDYLVTRGIRDACRLSIVIPFGAPVTPVAGHVAGAVGGLRRPRHRVRAQSPGGFARRRPQRCRT
jgi:sulfide:quinone oxidoreductase